jgi:hypothetical protein
MYKRFRLPLLLLLFCVVTRHHVMAQFTLSAEIRPRAEYRNGFKTVLPKDADAAFFVEQRSRLNAFFVSEKFDVRLSLQDVRNWGAVSQVYKSDPSLQNVYEAWASYKFNGTHSIAVGRMELDYDNVRILGNLDWAAQGRSHDLIKYEYNGEGMRIHVGVAFNQDAVTPEPAKLSSTFYNVPGNYKTMQYAWLHKDWKQSGLSLLLLNNGLQSPIDSSVTFTQTFGFYGTKSLGNTRLEYDGYYQIGESAPGRDISAYMFGVNATFWNNRPNNVSVGVDFLSGDKPDTSGKDEGFNPLYGTHHKFYGFMDHFYVGNAHGNKGLVDLFVRAKFKTGQKSSLLAHGHQFFAQSEIVNESDESLSSVLGTEIDLVYVLNVAPGVVLNVGWSAMRQTDSLELVKGVADGKTPTWGWAMISFKPTLFTTKNDKAEL